MKRTAAVILTGALLVQAIQIGRCDAAQPESLQFRITPTAAAQDVPRMGINLGGRTSWGAEQLMANVLANPGFEPTQDGAIVIVRAASGAEFTDDTPWLARPANFWKGASFSVRTGNLAGREGLIVDSGVWQGYPHLRANLELAGLAPGDVIALARQGGPELPAHWWWENSDRIHVSGDHPAQSEGLQSLVMVPDSARPVAAVSYIDMIGDRAGKLLPLHGRWSVTLWAKAAGPGQLTVQVRRLNRPPFLRQNFHPASAWRQYGFTFDPLDDGPPAGLEFRLEAEGAATGIWVDDVSLEPLTASSSGFRSEVVGTLRQLHPGYLRDWQGQLGDSLANRLADPTSRRPFRYRPGEESAFGYSLPEFLALCHEVDARPWIVLPTTLRDAEWTAAGAWLKTALAHYAFREVVVEFGNENWNALFRPAGIQDTGHMAEAAERGFRLLCEAAGNDKRVIPAIGGQFVNTGPLGPALNKAPHARIVAIAPYYARTFAAADTPANRLARLFEIDSNDLDQASPLPRNSARQAAIYEVNAHSLDGDADPEDVSRLLTSPASGSAILYHALAAMDRGIYRQCFYSLTGFDTFRSDGKLVRLFGLTRDLAEPGHLRPTGLAMELTNRAIADQSYNVVPVGRPDAGLSRPVAIRAFRGALGWNILAASASAEPVDITIEMPAKMGRIPNRLLRLQVPVPRVDQEDMADMSLHREPISSEANRIHFHLDPFESAAAYCEPEAVPYRNGSEHQPHRSTARQRP